MAFWDAVIRVFVGAILVWLGIEAGGIFKIGFWVGLVLMLTSLISFCPLYVISGVKTKCEEQTCQS